MANEISPPFSYKDFLIGEEIILRGLKQQEDFDRSGKFDASWSNDDRIEQGRAFFTSSVLRADFDMSGFEDCMPHPPCPWDKEGDDIPDNLFKDIIMANDGIFSYRYVIHKRMDAEGQKGYELGEKLFEYVIDQNKLDEIVRPEFGYYRKVGSANGYLGPAVIRIEKLHRGQLEDTFSYLFNFV